MATGQATFNLGIKTTADLSGVEKLKTALKEVSSLGTNTKFLKDRGLDDNAIQPAINAANRLQNALTSAFNPRLNTVNVTKFREEISKTYPSIVELKNDLDIAGTSGSKAFFEMTSTLMQVQPVVKQTQSWIEKLGKTFLNSVRYQVFNNIINEASSSIQQAYGYVKNLDSSLNDIQIITEKNADSMKEFAKQANNAAKSLGATTTDYTDASLIYYQQGLSDTEVAGRTDTTMKMANVLGSSASEVSDYMTAIWNNFDDGSKSLEYYGDVITKLGAETASSSEEIAEGLGKFASISDTVGLSYEYATSALATVVAETRQSADTVGTAFKTMFARIQDLELGNTLDDGTTLGTYSQALEKVGVNIKDQQGNLKDMDEILDEMGAKWKTLAKDEQVALAQNVAGTRQYTQLVALMDNWDEVQENISKATDATGTLESKNAIYLDSVEAHLNQLSSTAEDLYDSLLDSDTIKTFADGLTKLVQLGADFADSVGGLIPILGSLGATGLKVLSNQIGTSLAGIIQNIQVANEKIKTYEENATAISKMYNVNWNTKDITPEQKTVLDEMVEDYQKLNQYSNVMTDEQKEAYNILQQQRAELGGELDQFSKIAEALNKTNTGNWDNIKIQNIFSDTTQLENFKQALNSVSNDGVQALANLSRSTSITKKSFDSTLASLSENAKIGGLNLENLVNELNQVAKSMNINSKSNASQIFTIDDSGIVQFNGKMNELNKNWVNLREVFRNTKLELSPQILENLESLIQKENECKQASQNMFETASTAQFISDITRITGAIGQMAMGIQTLSNLGDVWTSDEEVGQKLLKTVLNLTMSISMLASPLSTMITTTTKRLKEIAPIEAEIKALKESEAIQERIIQGYSKNKVVVGKAQAKLEELQTEEKEKQALLDKQDIGLFPAIIGYLTAEEGLNKQIAKDKLQQVWADKKKSIQEAFKSIGSLITKIPIWGKIAIGVVAAITVAISASVAAWRKHLSNIAGETEATAARFANLTEEAQTQADSINELADAYKELKDSWDDLNEDEKRQQVYQLCMQYNQQTLAIKALTGSYADLDDLITKVQEDANADLAAAAQKSSDAAEAAVYNRIRATVQSKKHGKLNYHNEGTIGNVRNSSDSGLSFLSDDTISLVGINGPANAKAKESFIAQMKEMGVSIEGNRMSMEDFVKAAAKYGDTFESVINSYDFKAAKQLQDVYSTISDDLDTYTEQLDTYKDSQKTAIENSIDIDSITNLSDYYKNLNSMITEALNKDLFDTYDEAEDWAQAWMASIDEVYKYASADTVASAVSDNLYDENSFLDSQYKKYTSNQQSDYTREDTLLSWRNQISSNPNDYYSTFKQDELYKISNAYSLDDKDSLKDIQDEINNYIDNSSNLDDNTKEIEKQIWSSYIDTINTNWDNFALSDVEDVLDSTSIWNNEEDRRNYQEQQKEQLAQQIQDWSAGEKNTLFSSSYGFKINYENDLDQFKEDFQSVSDYIDQNNTHDILFNLATSEDSELTDETIEDLFNDGGIFSNLIGGMSEEEFKSLDSDTQSRLITDAFLGSEEDWAAAGKEASEELTKQIDLLEATAQQEEKVDQVDENGNVVQEGAWTKASNMLDKFALNSQGYDENGVAYTDKKSRAADVSGEGDKVKRSYYTDDNSFTADEIIAIQEKMNANAEKGVDINTGLSDQEKAQYALAEKMAESNETTVEDLVTLNKEYEDYTEQIATWSEEADNAANAQENIEDSITTLDNRIKTLNSDIDDIQSAYKTLTSTVDEYNSNGALSMDTIQSLMDLDDDYLAALTLDENGLHLDEEAIKSLMRVKVTELEQRLYEVAVKKIENLETAKSTTLNYAEAESVGELSQAMEDSKEKFENYINEWDKLNTEQQQVWTNTQNLVNLLEGSVDSMDFSGFMSGYSSSSSSSDQQKELKYLDDEFDRYYALNKAIDDVADSLSDLSKLQEHLSGKQLIASLKKQNELLEQQAKDYQALAAEQAKQGGELKDELGNYGVTFANDNNISNYAQITAEQLQKYNDAVNSYNAGTMSEEAFDVVEKEYENFKDKLSDYESLLTDYQDTINNLDDIYYEKLENNLKAWETEISLKLEFTEAQRDWDEFVSNLNTDVKLKFEDIDANLNLDSAKIDSLTLDKSTIESAMAEIGTEIEAFASNPAYQSDKYASITEAQEELKTYKDKWVDTVNDIRDAWKDAYDQYLQGIDDEVEKIQNVNDAYDRQIERLDHINKLNELLYGENNFDTKDQILATQAQVQQSQMQNYKEQAELWKEYYLKAVEDGDEQAAEKYQKAYQEAIDNLYSTEEKYIQTLLDKYENGINEIFNNLDKQLSGGSSLDWISEQWDLEKEAADGYYDSVERVYELQSMQDKWQSAIDSADSLKAQQKLKKLMDEEMASLEGKTELSEYDIELAEKRLAVAQAEAALEDAQNNKNTMKLTRGADGNWSYQYVADEDDVNDKQQALLDAQNEAYEFAKQSWSELQETLITTTQTALEKIQELELAKATATEEEKLLIDQQIAYYQNYYENRIAQLATESAEREQNLKTETCAFTQELYNTDVDNYTLMTEAEQELLDAMKENELADLTDIYTATGENYDLIQAKADDVLITGDNSISALWDSAAANTIRGWYSDPGSVKNTFDLAIDECEAKQMELNETVAEGTEYAGENYLNLASQINNVSNTVAYLDAETAAMCSSAANALSGYISYVNSLNDSYNALIGTVQSAIQEIQALLALQGQASEVNVSSQYVANSGTQTTATTQITSAERPTTSYGDNTTVYVVRDANSGEIVDYSRKDIFSAYDDQYYDDEKMTLTEYQKLKAQGYDTGGYTGSWNDGSGKLAMLHSKELVLNADDTANMLQVVDSVRDISSIGSSISNSIAQSIASMITNLAGAGLGITGTGSTTNDNNTFNITAEFPNANNVDDIREAILSLPNLASQYLHQKF